LDATVARFPAVGVGSYPRCDDADHRVKVTVDSRDEGQVRAAAEFLKSRLPGGVIVREEWEYGSKTWPQCAPCGAERLLRADREIRLADGESRQARALRPLQPALDLAADDGNGGRRIAADRESDALRALTDPERERVPVRRRFRGDVRRQPRERLARLLTKVWREPLAKHRIRR